MSEVLTAGGGRSASILLDLAKSPNVGSGNLAAALQEITEAAATVLDVERASVWLYSPDRREIRCIDLFSTTIREHTAGTRLVADDYPRYFEALDENRAIAADDAHTDWRTREFSAGYLTPLGINSMLDAPLRVGGEMIGVVCHEHIGAARHWSTEEESFAGSIADYAALAIQANELRSAREVAQAASRAKSAVLANLSHELRTPLNVIIGFSELLREKAESPTAEKLATIESAGRTLLAMIDELLEIAALEAGLTSLDWEAFSLERLVQSIVAEMRIPIEAKGNRLEMGGAAPSLVMNGDPGKLWRVLWNLLDNANKFTEQGTIELAVEPLPGNRVRFVVRDTGIGIAPEHLPTIFESFVQADASFRRRHRGAGLGLAITRRLCELMGGTIEARSTLGEGSTFIVEIGERSSFAR